MWNNDGMRNFLIICTTPKLPWEKLQTKFHFKKGESSRHEVVIVLKMAAIMNKICMPNAMKAWAKGNFSKSYSGEDTSNAYATNWISAW